MVISSIPSTAPSFAVIMGHSGMTQDDAAKYLGVSRVTINRWVSGKSSPPIGMYKCLVMYKVLKDHGLAY